MRRIAIGKIFLLFLLLFTIGCGSSVSGHYSSRKNPHDSMVLTDDGSISIDQQQPSLNVTGSYHVDGDVITVNLNGYPPISGRVAGNTIYDNENIAWDKI